MKLFAWRAFERARPAAVREDEDAIRSELFSVERLEQHAQSLATSQPVHAALTAGKSLVVRLRDNERVLLAAYRSIAAAVDAGRPVTPAAEWLLDNFHLVEQQVREVRTDLPAGYYRQLPKLSEGPLAGYPRVFGLAWAFVAHTDSRFDPETLTPEIRRAIVTNGARAVFHQTLEVGFFHADPHPGNIFVHDDGAITFIDCGMTGFVDETTRLRLAEIVYGVVRNDADGVTRAAIAVADVDVDEVDLAAVRLDVERLVARFVGVPLERIDLGGVLEEFFGTLRRHDLRCPAGIVLLIKAMSTIEGVASDVDPTFDLVSFTQPYIERLLKSRFSPKAMARRVRNAALELVSFGESLPGDVSSLLRKLRRNRLRIQLDLVAIEDVVAGVEDASERLGYAILIASLVMASAILVLASDGKGVIWLLGLIGFIASATLAFGLIINSWRRRRRLRKLGRKLRQARGER